MLIIINCILNGHRRLKIKEEQMVDQNRGINDRPYQCDFDLENNSEALSGKGAYSTPYTCAVCGAGARDSSNLCAPERRGGSDRGKRGR
jgi:hypothetical protein